MSRKKWTAAAVGAALVVVLGAGAVMAQTTPNPTGSSFLDRVAQKLGIDAPKLQKAITDTRNEDIDAAVKNGDLTQKQADALKAKTLNTPGFGGRGHDGPEDVPGGREGFPDGFGMRHGPKGFGLGLPGAEQKVADFLGTPLDALKVEMGANGATLASVAQAHGKSRDQLKSFITDTAKATLDAAVKNGDLTQKRADAALAMLSANLDKLIDGNMGAFGHGFGHGRRMKPNAPTMPAPQGGSGISGAQSF